MKVQFIDEMPQAKDLYLSLAIGSSPLIETPERRYLCNQRLPTYDRYNDGVRCIADGATALRRWYTYTTEKDAQDLDVQDPDEDTAQYLCQRCYDYEHAGGDAFHWQCMSRKEFAEHVAAEDIAGPVQAKISNAKIEY